jgi:hypothetical protein
MKPGYSRMHDVNKTKNQSLLKQHYPHVIMTDISRLKKINKVKA